MSLLTSRAFPTVLQALGVIAFGYLIYVGLFGSPLAGKNFASALTWILWWPGVVFTFILIGRAWCSACPLGAISAAAQRFGLGRAFPHVLRGVGLSIFLFILVTWSNHYFKIVTNPRATAWFMALWLVLALAIGFTFERRSWCRYACPIGALFGVYSMTSLLELRPNREVCAQCGSPRCLTGDGKEEGCPMGEFPGNMSSNRNCIYCMKCLKTCPSGSMTLRWRQPWRELTNIRRPLAGEALLAVVILGLVAFDTFVMVAPFQQLYKAFYIALPIADPELVMVLIFLLLLAAPLLLYSVASIIASRALGSGFWPAFGSFGYAYIPLALAGHLGHNFFHLVGEGGGGANTILATFGVYTRLPTSLLGTEAIKGLQILTMGLGIILSVYVAYHIARSRGAPRAALPHLLLILLLASSLLFLLSLPMGMRH